MAAAPTITSVSSTASGLYGLGRTISLSITFDQAVSVTGGTPVLQLETGSVDRLATYAGGSGSATLDFTYTVQAGDVSADLDYFGTAALALAGSTIRAVAGGLDATLTLPQPGTAGSLGANEAIVIDGAVPATPDAPDLVSGSDRGVSSTDNLTSDAAPTIRGSGVEANAQVTLYDTDGSVLGALHADAAGNWSMPLLATLADGEHRLTVTATDSAGNQSLPSAATTVTIDTVAPTLAITSDKATVNASETATITFTFSEDPASTFTAADITVHGGTLGPLTGSGTHYTATFTPQAGLDGTPASITVAWGSYVDKAGNVGGAGATPALLVDTVAPAAPGAPTLAVASDTGDIGDHVTSSTTQVIEGTGEAGATITLYDGAVVLGPATVDANGKWTYTAHLGVGNHALAAVQVDKAGNASSASTGFQLTVAPPPSPPVPPAPDDDFALVDGAPVTTTTTVLAGGLLGTRVDVPIVGTGMGGADGIADIALPGTGLTAHLPVGYGLTAATVQTDAAHVAGFVTGAVAAVADQARFAHAAGQFLHATHAETVQLASLVPSSTAHPTGTLAIDAATPFAAIVDARAMADGALALTGTGFAGVLGTATVALHGAGVLAGDAAHQDLTAYAGDATQVLAGGGNDTLRLAVPAAPAAGTPDTVTLHGGTGTDTAVFTGAQADYTVAFHNGYVLVAAKAAPQAQALVVNVEQLQFADGTVQVAADGAGATVAGLYDMVLGRQADLAGFTFWADRHAAGASWGATALGMLDSAEYKAGHEGLNGNAAHDVELLYQALLGRAPDAAGYAFWQAALEHGMSLEQVATQFVVSAEMIGHQKAAAEWDFSV